MSATMATQEGQVQQEQSVMRLTLIRAKMAKRLFVRNNRKNAIPDHVTLHRLLKREEAGCLVSWRSNCEGCNTKTPGYASSKPCRRMTPLPK